MTDLPMYDPPVLRFDSLCIGVAGKGGIRPLVSDVTLELRKGEVLCVVGESGSGKSLTARSTIGLFASPSLKVTGGRVLLGDEDLTLLTTSRKRAIRGSRIAMIFQEPMTALNPLMKVGAQVEEVFRIHSDYGSEERRRRVLDLFSEVRLPNPERVFGAYPHELSGGQRQRVMIAMALSLEPDVLLADEPTTALDVTTQRQILRLMRELQDKRGTSILFITHDFGVVSEIAHRVAVMEKGRLVEIGEASEVLRNPQHPYTKSLIAAVPAVGALRRGTESRQVLLQATNLSKWYGRPKSPFAKSAPKDGVAALDKVSISVRKGETLGIVGESGSGKTTMGRVLAGLLPVDEGMVSYGGRPVELTGRGDLKWFRREVQIVFQDPFGSLNPRRRVGDLIAAGPRANGVAKDVAWAKAGKMLELVGLSGDARNSFPHQFSGGQRQRIAIARALAIDPSLVIADEATSALDVSVQAQILELLAELKQRLSLTLVFITHDLRVAAGICDSVAVMQHGRVVEQGTAADVFSQPAHEYTRSLLASVPGFGEPRGGQEPSSKAPKHLQGSWK